MGGRVGTLLLHIFVLSNHPRPVPGRHYLDFINHFVKLYNEKRADLEEQQLHLNVGLNKIAETVEQVEEMQKSLAVKSQVRGTVKRWSHRQV